jgi:hypothetical protein
LPDDAKPISEVYRMFIRLREHFASSRHADRVTILLRIYARWNFVFHDVHAIAYLLDPRYLGKNMEVKLDGTRDEELRERTVDEINRRSRLIDPVDGDILANAEYDRFTAWVSKYPLYITAVNDGKQSVLQWWACRSNQFPNLARIAMQVFCCVSSSSASERNFSAFGFIRGKLRSRLADQKVAKLVNVFANSKQLSKFCDHYDEDHLSCDFERMNFTALGSIYDNKGPLNLT